jgi:hypothetical protein
MLLFFLQTGDNATLSNIASQEIISLSGECWEATRCKLNAMKPENFKTAMSEAACLKNCKIFLEFFKRHVL